jgi:hypothetical protein
MVAGGRRYVEIHVLTRLSSQFNGDLSSGLISVFISI